MLIKEYRKLRKISQAELANAIGVTSSVISRYERGNISPPTNKLSAIAKVLEISVDDLLGETVNVETAPPSPKDFSEQQLDWIPPIHDKATTFPEVDFLPVQPIHQDHVAFFQPTSLLRRYLIEQSGGRCELCNQKAPVPNMNDYFEAHHIIWMRQGGRNDVSNIVILCPNCHKKVHLVNSPEDIEKLINVAAKHKEL